MANLYVRVWVSPEDALPERLIVSASPIHVPPLKVGVVAGMVAVKETVDVPTVVFPLYVVQVIVPVPDFALVS